MARIYWLCRLYQPYPTRPFWHPRIEAIRNGPTGVFPCAWTTTDVDRAVPWACGVADVTPEQLAAIAADGGIHVAEEANWFQQWNQLPAARRLALRALLTDMGLATPENAEVLRDLWTRIVQNNEPMKSIDSILHELPTP